VPRPSQDSSPPSAAPARGCFVVIDGADGCGKSTQAERLVRSLRAGGRKVLHLREPGSTRVGEGLREILLAPESRIGPEVETLLFAAARRQMLDELVAPALARGEHVVCERFHPSTFAYQAVAGELEENQVMALLQTWASPLLPDLVVLLDVDVERAAERRGGATDRIEAKGLAFQARVAEGYRRYARRDPQAVVLDGSRDPEHVEAELRREVDRVL